MKIVTYLKQWLFIKREPFYYQGYKRWQMRFEKNAFRPNGGPAVIADNGNKVWFEKKHEGEYDFHRTGGPLLMLADGTKKITSETMQVPL